MAINYNKDRQLLTGGPRDRQIKQLLQSNQQSQIDSSVVNSLRDQIRELQEQLLNSPRNSDYTDEKVNNLLKEALKDQALMYENTINSLKLIITSKDELIQSLKEQISTNKLTSVISDTYSDGNTNVRPTIGTVFIDPIDSSDNVESFISIDSSQNSDSSQINDKVNKLKNLLGSKKS